MSDDKIVDEFIDRYLEHLDGNGPEPQLDDLPEHLRADAAVHSRAIAAAWRAIPNSNPRCFGPYRRGSGSASKSSRSARTSRPYLRVARRRVVVAKVREPGCDGGHINVRTGAHT